jgi:hypothetical protein
MNNGTIGLILAITVINIFISAFGIESTNWQPLESAAYYFSIHVKSDWCIHIFHLPWRHLYAMYIQCTFQIKISIISSHQ